MKTIHLIVESGKDSGKEIHVPAGGSRLGRAEKNDIILGDPLLSRYHCRFLFTPEGTLMVADLASSNATMVNNVEVMEQVLKLGDLVQVGDTVLKVVNAGTQAPAAAPAVAGVDLGLAAAPKVNRTIPSGGEPQKGKGLGKSKLIGIAGSVLIVVLVVFAIAVLMKPSDDGSAAPVAPVPEPDVLSVEYEKVEADASNIFRYHLTITPELDIAIEIDDLMNNRTVRKEKKLDEDLVQNLIRHIKNSTYFDLRNEYTGVQPEVFNQWDLAITINEKTHSVRVLNRPEPEAFKDIREEIEVFGKNELGLWAIQFSTEKLVEMAKNSYLAAKTLFAERAVKYSNLFDALQNFQKVVIDLETVEPKPDFYADAVAMITQCRDMLQSQYDDLSFQVERSIRLQEWETAASRLRVIQEMIPDRSDDRNKQARKQLLDVEERIKANE